MKTILLVMLSVIIGALLTGCTGFQVEVLSPEMVVAASELQAAASPTLISQAGTATRTPTNTPRPTSTPIPTRTPTATAASTATPRPTVMATRQTPTPTATVDDSDQLLRLRDLPRGFERIDPIEMGLSEEALASSPVAVESIFAFVNPEVSEFIGGGTTRLATFFDRIAFDLMINNPELITTLVLGNLENVSLSRLEDMGLPLIGDNSKGLTVVAEVDGVQMRANLILFRRGSQGVALAQLYPNEEDATVAVSELATLLAQRTR